MAKRWYYKDENGNKVPVPQYKINADDYYTKAMSDSRYYEKSATDTLLADKVSKSDVVQSTGTSTTSVMSQKASTMAFAANTPSGDPMHNVYVAVGAVWNAKTGFWELNGLKDITNEQMLTIYVETNNFLMNQSTMEACYCFSKCRTNIPNIPYLSAIGRLGGDWRDFFRQSENVEVGAIYNDTGKDIERVDQWGDTIIHKNGCWYLNGLGDLTNADMNRCWVYGNCIYHGYNFNISTASEY